MMSRFHVQQLQAFQLPAVQSVSAIKIVWVCVFVLLLLGGCVTKQPYGSFVQHPEQTYSRVIADDVTAQIIRLYPAASTQFDLRHRVDDPFGEALIDNLRNAGYAIWDRGEDDDALQSILDQGMALRYIIDQSDDLYHVSILIDDQRLTRAFTAQSGQIQPAGLWLKQESTGKQRQNSKHHDTQP